MERRKLFASGATFVIQVAALVSLATAPRLLSGFPLDDAWIHQVVARTFATTGTLGYLPGHFGSGSTSYAWAVLLAPNPLIFHADPVLYTFALTTIFWLCTGQVLLRALLRGSGDSTFDLARAALSAGLASASGNVLWFVFSGMEATLFAALSIAGLTLFAASSRGNARRPMGAALCFFVLMMTRPEAIMIGLVLVFWAFRRQAPKRESAIAISGWAFGALAYASMNLIATGQLAPRTLDGRKWMWLGTQAGRSRVSMALDLPAQWASRLREYTLGLPSSAVFFCAVGLAAIGLYELNRRHANGIRLIVVWTALHLLTFAIFMPTMGHGGRYQPLLPLVFVLLATYGAATAAKVVVSRVALLPNWPFDFASAHVDLVAIGMTAALLVPCTWLGIERWREAEPLAVDHIRTTEIGLADEFRKLPADAKIASFDIGAAGFFDDHSIVDLGGLTDPTIVPVLRDGLVWTYLRDHHVDYVALPLGYDDSVPDLFNFGYRLHLFDSPHVALEPISFLRSPEPIWLPGIMSTMHSAPRQGIYRVTFPDAPHPSPSLAPNAVAHVSDEDRALDPNDRSELIHAASAIARAGVPIDLRIVTTATDPRVNVSTPTNELAIDVGPMGVRAHFPPQLAGLPAAEMDRIWQAGEAEYLRVGDLSGAAREALFLLTVGVKRYVDPTFDPLLAPTPAPTPSTLIRSPLAHDGVWGWPLSLAMVAAFLLLDRRRMLNAAPTVPACA